MNDLSNINDLLAAGELAEAEAFLRSLVDHRGAMAGSAVFYKLALVAEALGKTDEILPWLRYAVAVDPNHSMAWLMKGLQLMDRNPIEAEAALTRAARLEPGDPDCWRALARVRFQLRDWSGCERALQELPDDAETMAMQTRIGVESGGIAPAAAIVATTGQHH